MKKFLALILAVMMMALVVTSCSGGDSTDESNGGTDGSIKIGVLAPLTGDVSVYGNAAVNGINLAVKEINANGGVLGQQIELVTLDEKGDVNEAMTAFNNLASQGVVAVIGDVTTKPCIAVSELAQEIGMPMLTPTGTGPEVTEAGDYVFRTCFTDTYQGTIMAEFSSQNLGIETVAVMTNNSDDYSRGVSDEFIAKCEENGIEVVAQEGYGSTDQDFNAQVTKIASLNPDALFIPDYYNTVALIVEQARTAGYNNTIMGVDGWDGVLDVIGEDKLSLVDGCYFCSHYSPDSTDEKVVTFVDAYETEYNGEVPKSFAALGYDSVYMMAQAIEEAGSTDPEAIKDALASISFSGVTGDITLDENRNPIKDVAIIKLENGEAHFETTIK